MMLRADDICLVGGMCIISIEISMISFIPLVVWVNPKHRIAVEIDELLGMCPLLAFL